MTPFIAEVLDANGSEWDYAEPYAGGAGVAMGLLIDGRVRRVHLNDSSRHVYAFWHSILKEPEAFCRRISRASLTIDAWREHREVVRRPEEHDLLDLGFSTFFLNRCNRSGILTAGVIGGQAQTGEWLIDARFPRNELIRRITVIADQRHRIRLSHLDAEVFLATKVSSLPKGTLVYLDPPYFARAKKLYLNTYEPADHARLAKAVQKVRHPWIVSYDANASIAALYPKRRKFTYSLQYSAVRAYAGRELFIFSDRLAVPATSSLPYVADGLRRLA